MKRELFCKGYTWGWCSRKGDYLKPCADSSLRELKEMGAEWVAICFDLTQDTFASTRIYFDYSRTVTDLDIINAVRMAKDIGFKVCLKPVVNPADGVWRQYINFPDEAPQYWDQWFKSYTDAMVHYADLAQYLNCEMFCTGCEMGGADRKTNYWKKMLTTVREHYDGLLTYNFQYDRGINTEVCGELDAIGLSLYHPVGRVADDVEGMVSEFRKVADDLKKIHDITKKPILFMETGCVNGKGATKEPWAHQFDENDEDEQERFYKSIMEVFWDQEWFSGYFWWDWPSNLYPIEKANEIISFCIYGKKASAVLKDWYLNR